MKIAGLRKRNLRTSINGIMCLVTVGIYALFIVINFFRAKPNIGQRITGLKFDGELKMGKLFLFGILSKLLKCLVIPYFIELWSIILKSGTFAEKWSKTFTVL